MATKTRKGARVRRAPTRRRAASRATRAYHHGNLRPALLAAAADILAKDGLAALSLRAASRRAGVSQTAPYRHFADKDALVAALAAGGFRELARHMAAAARGLVETGAVIEALGAGYLRFARASPHLLRLMFGPPLERKADYPELKEAAEMAYAMLRQAIGAHVAGADPPLDPDIVTVAAWASVHGLATLIIDRQIAPEMSGGLDPESLCERITGLFVDGLDSLLGH